MERSGWITLAVLGVILLLVAWYLGQVQDKNQLEKQAESPAAVALAPTGIYTDLNGEPLSLDNYIGQTVVVAAWASWCLSCAVQLSELSQLAAENPDVAVLAINRAESASQVRAYFSHFGLEGTIEPILDPQDHFFDSIEGYTMPEVVIYTANGDISHHERGALPQERLQLLVAEVEQMTSQN
jgi:thiol-disulfide isomerase/thioredoxin